MTALAERIETSIAEVAPARPATPMEMAFQLIQGGADFGSVKEMLAMSRELAADQARQKFDAAMSLAKAEITPVVKTAEGHNGKKYADFASIAKAVDPIISRHGLSYRFRTKQDDRIHVTCVLAHEAGHAEETTLSGPADTTGSKNAIQAIGSTLTYLQRYTLVQALGLAASADDDGQAAGGVPDRISTQQRDELLELIEQTGTPAEKFCATFGIDAVPDLPASAFIAATSLMRSKLKMKASNADA